MSYYAMLYHNVPATSRNDNNDHYQEKFTMDLENQDLEIFLLTSMPETKYMR